MLNFSFSSIDGFRAMALSGSLTSSTIGNFQAAVEDFVMKDNLIINVENITLITTAGLNALIEVSYLARENGKRVIILWPGKDLLEIAENLSAYPHLTFAQNLDEAKLKIKHFT